MKRPILLLVFLVACMSSLLAQTTATYTDVSTTASEDSNGGINIHATLSPKGAITLDTGPIGPLLTSGGTFSGNGGYFNYSCGSMGSGSIFNVAGSLVVLSTSVQGSGTLTKYQLTMTFSGHDNSGRTVSGDTIQMFSLSQSKSGVTSVKVIGGTMDLTVY